MADQTSKKEKRIPNFAIWYAILGFLFGIIAVVFATVVALLDAQLPITLENAVRQHLTNPLLWFFDITPIVFALLLGLVGRNESRVRRERQKSLQNSEKLAAENVNFKNQIGNHKNQIAFLEKWNHDLETSLKTQQDSNQALQTSMTSEQEASKSAEAIISRAKQQWEAVFDAVQDMIVLTNTDGVIVRCNRAAAEAFNMEFTQIVGIPIASLIGGEADSQTWPISPGKKAAIKIPVLERWFEVSTSSLNLEDNQPGIVSIFRDITERRQATANLQLQKQYYESVIKNNPIAIVTLQMDHTIVECNPAFEKLFGFSAGEVFGKDPEDLIMPEGFEDEMRGFAEAARLGEPVHALTYGKRKDNRLVEVEYFQTPMISQGRLVGTLAFYHDISELAHSRQEIAAADNAGAEVDERGINPAEAAAAALAVEGEGVEKKAGPAELKSGKAGYKIEKIEGIGPAYAMKLSTVGVTTTDDLLRLGATRRGREELTEQTGLSHKLILAWVNRADLMRVPGVGEEYSDLLEMAGVDTVKELRRRSPENLHKKMLAKNEERKVVRRVPTLNEVTAWIEAAKEIEAILTY